MVRGACPYSLLCSGFGPKEPLFLILFSDTFSVPGYVLGTMASAMTKTASLLPRVSLAQPLDVWLPSSLSTCRRSVCPYLSLPTHPSTCVSISPACQYTYVSDCVSVDLSDSAVVTNGPMSAGGNQPVPGLPMVLVLTLMCSVCFPGFPPSPQGHGLCPVHDSSLCLVLAAQG